MALSTFQSFMYLVLKNSINETKVADNKTMIHIIIGKQVWWNSEWTNYFEPTIAAGKLAVEKMVEQQIALPTTNAGEIDWNNVATSTAGAEMETLAVLFIG